MFRSFIYLDENKLYNYKRLIEGNCTQAKTVNQKKTKSASAGISKASFSYSNEENRVTEIEKDPFWDYDRFELALNDLSEQDFFDFVMNEDSYDILSVPAMKILKLASTIEIPEEFDVLQLLDSFKPYLIDSVIETKSSNDQQILNSVFGNAKADIPIILDCDGLSVVGRLNTEHLLEDYTMLEDYTEQDVTALCKVVGVSKQERVPIFNPLKDFIKLNRAMRRSGNFDSVEGLDPIVIDGPVVKVEIIALYK